MKNQKILFIGIGMALWLSSCSVQQFAVNTQTKPFQQGGKVFGEKTDSLEVARAADWHVIGINVKNSNVDELVQQLDAKAYTIETKSNLWLNLVSLGMVDYKVVTVIKRDN